MAKTNVFFPSLFSLYYWSFADCHYVSYHLLWDWITYLFGSHYILVLNIPNVFLPGGSDSRESACNKGGPDSISGLGKSAGEGNSYPLQYSCLENSKDWGAWKAIVHGATKSQTWLSDDCYCIAQKSSRLFVVQSLSHVQLFTTLRTAAHQASLSFTISQSLLKLMSIELVMPSYHLILCRPLLLLPSIFPSIRVFSNESALHIRWPKYWSFSFSISSSNECLGLISFRTYWCDLLAVQGTLNYTRALCLDFHRDLFHQHLHKLWGPL